MDSANSQRDKLDSTNSRRYKVKVTEDGPYLVSGGVPLLDEIECIGDDGGPQGWKEGRRYPAKENYALCRCGHSRRMPYCDGSHTRVGFAGAETAEHVPYLDQSRNYDGPELWLSDAKAYCMGAGFCHRGGGTWSLTERSDDPEAKKAAIEEACDCPSGRLVAWQKDGEAIEPKFDPSIGVIVDCEGRKAGPLWVRGGVPVESVDGRVYEVRNRVTLCGCGRSANKPFCDGSHDE